MRVIKEERVKFMEKNGVSCFTESKDNVLMWSHYADKGRGVCLEFDTKFEQFTQLRHVEYVDSIPELNAVPVYLHNDVDQLIDLFYTKSVDWSYEREWRSLHDVAGTEIFYESKVLKAVYFGPKIDPSKSEIACSILHGRNPDRKLYWGKYSKKEFKVEFTEFNYIPMKDR